MSKCIAKEYYNEYHPSREMTGAFDSLTNQIDLHITSNDREMLTMEIVNAPVHMHNVIRRIILTEVPTVAFDRIYLYNNTTCMEDSELASRIGLLPIDLNPDDLKLFGTDLPDTDEEMSAFKPDSCLLFELIVDFSSLGKTYQDIFKTFVDPKGTNAINSFAEKYRQRKDRSVYSADMKQVLLKDQKRELSNVKLIEDILLSRLMPGEEINLRAMAVKGFGHDHAKFKPTSHVNCRSAYTMKLLKPIQGDHAKILKKLYPEGVIKIKKSVAHVGDTKLIKRMNKNVFEYEELKDKVELGYNESVFVWEIESTRPKNQPADAIFRGALQSMVEKCRFYQNNLNKLLEAINNSPNTVVDAQKLGAQLNGKFRYLEKDTKTRKNPIYRFNSELEPLGESLCFMSQYLFGEKAACSYVVSGTGINVFVISNLNPDEILSETLNALANFYHHLMGLFDNKIKSFFGNNVDME